MNSIENGKVTKIKCVCSCCIEHLKTNSLCKLGRDTTKTKYCKWYYAGKNTAHKQKKAKPQKVKTMQEVIDSINKSIEERKIKQQKKHEERFNK